MIEKVTIFASFGSYKIIHRLAVLIIALRNDRKGIRDHTFHRKLQNLPVISEHGSDGVSAHHLLGISHNADCIFYFFRRVTVFFLVKSIDMHAIAFLYEVVITPLLIR